MTSFVIPFIMLTDNTFISSISIAGLSLLNDIWCFIPKEKQREFSYFLEKTNLTPYIETLRPNFDMKFYLLLLKNSRKEFQEKLFMALSKSIKSSKTHHFFIEEDFKIIYTNVSLEVIDKMWNYSEPPIRNFIVNELAIHHDLFKNNINLENVSMPFLLILWSLSPEEYLLRVENKIVQYIKENRKISEEFLKDSNIAKIVWRLLMCDNKTISDYSISMIELIKCKSLINNLVQYTGNEDIDSSLCNGNYDDIELLHFNSNRK